MIVNADGSGEPVALDGIWVSVSWSPDGERLLLTGFPADEGDFDLYTVHPDGSDLVQLTHDEVTEHEPAWSPDGTRIAFASDREATPEQRDANRSGDAIFTGLSLYAMRADGSDVTRLLQSDSALPVSWSP